MNNALVRFFNKIKFEFNDSFKDTTVSKVVVNKQKETWCVYLKSPKVIDIFEMQSLFNQASLGIDGVEKIDIVTEYDIITNEDIINYVEYFLKEKIAENPSLSSIKDSKLEVIDERIDIEVITPIEEKLLLSFNNELLKYLEKYGITKVLLNPIINLEKRDEIKNEILNSKVDIVVNKEPTYKIIMGEDIKTKKVSNIKDILGEENNIVIDAYVFGFEEFI